MFKSQFHFPSDITLPAALTELSVRCKVDLYPPNLKILDILTDYPIPTLPANLQSLSVYGNFTFMPKDYPYTLTEIILTLYDNIIPAVHLICGLPNLKYFSFSFYRILAGNFKPLLLPPKLLDIRIIAIYHQPLFSQFLHSIDFTLAPLTSIQISNAWCGYMQDAQCSNQLPPSLTRLVLYTIIFTTPFPPALQQLEILTKAPFILPLLPTSLTSLNCTNCTPPPSFPPNLISLHLDNFTEPLPPLPSKIKILNLLHPRGKSHRQLPEVPPSLQSLYAQKYYLTSTTIIPPKIDHFAIGYSWCTKLPVFPTTVTTITLG